MNGAPGRRGVRLFAFSVVWSHFWPSDVAFPARPDLALLISILLPALNRAREQARMVQCSSNMRQLGQALLMYAHDHNGILPPIQFGWQEWGGSASNNPPQPDDVHGWPVSSNLSVWSHFLWPYASETLDLFICPTMRDEHLTRWPNSHPHRPQRRRSADGR